MSGSIAGWSAWSHRDTLNPHLPAIIRHGGLSERQFARLEGSIQRAAERTHQGIRERQREYARKLERAREQSRGPEL
jgi:hypothetical protein